MCKELTFISIMFLVLPKNFIVRNFLEQKPYKPLKQFRKIVVSLGISFEII